MSYGRVTHPSEMVHIGQELEVKVLDIDWERERISLGLKQLQSYPWKDVADKYPVGTRVAGKVVSITNYGAFIELEPGIEGLVHISEMSWTRNVSRFFTGFVSMSDPGRNALIPPTSTASPPFTRSTTRPLIG